MKAKHIKIAIIFFWLQALSFNLLAQEKSQKDEAASEKIEIPPQAKELGFPLTIPYIGKFTLTFFVDTTKTPIEEGFKVRFADPEKKVELGPLSIWDGTLYIVNGLLRMTGQASLFNKKAHFELKEVEFESTKAGESKKIKRATFDLTFEKTEPLTIDLLPGHPIPLTEVYLEVKESSLQLTVKVLLFDQEATAVFDISTEEVNVNVKLPTILLTKVIPQVASIPTFAKAELADASLEVKNFWTKTKDPDKKRVTTIKGTVQLPSAPAEAKSAAAKEEGAPAESASEAQPEAAEATPEKQKFDFQATLQSDGTSASLTASKFKLPRVGIFTNATISIDTITKPAITTIKGILNFDAAVFPTLTNVALDTTIELTSDQADPKKKIFNLKAKIASILLSKIIPYISTIPALAQAELTDASLEVNNVFAKEARTSTIQGTVQLPSGPLGIAGISAGEQPSSGESETPAKQHFDFSATLQHDGISASLNALKFHLPGIGILNNTTIGINTINKPTQVTLKGTMNFDITGAGQLVVDVDSTISKEGINFSGKVKKEFTYANATIKDITVSFDTKTKAVTLHGNLFLPFLNLTLDSTIELSRDPDDPHKKLFNIKTKTSAMKLEPFKNIPGLKVIYIKDFTVGLEAAKQAEGKKTFNIVLKGDLYISDTIFGATVRIIENEQGQKGIYIKTPPAQNKKMSEFLPFFSGKIFQEIELKEAWLAASSIEFTDPDTNEQVKRGLSFFAKVPLSGALKEAGDFLGSKDQTVAMNGSIRLDNMQESEFGIVLSEGAGDPTKVVTMGPTSIAITGKPSLEVKTEIQFRPSEKEKEHPLLLKGKIYFAAQQVPGTTVPVPAGEVGIQASLDGEWKDPFGIPNSSVKNIVLDVGMATGSPGIPTKLEGGGVMQLGNSKNPKDNLYAKAYFAANAPTFDQLAIKGDISESLSLSKIAFKILKNLYNVDLAKFFIPDPEFRNLKFEIAPKDTQIGQELIHQGMSISGEFPYLDSTAYVDILVRRPTLGANFGFRIFGAIDPISMAKGALKITKSAQESKEGECFVPKTTDIEPCKIPSTETIKLAREKFEKEELEKEHDVKMGDKPRVDIELTLLRQNFLISGQFNLVNLFAADACASIDSQGIHFMFVTGLRDNNGKEIMWGDKALFEARIICNANDLGNPQLDIDFMQNLQQYLRENAVAGFKKGQDAITQGIATAKQEIDKIEKIKADAAAKIKEASDQVEKINKSLVEPIESKEKDIEVAFEKEEKNAQDKIDALKKKWNELPDF